jgi:hypothetical protein
VLLAHLGVRGFRKEVVEDGRRRVGERVVGLAEPCRGEALWDDGYAIRAVGR